MQLSNLSRQDKLQLLTALTEKEARQLANPLKFWKPTTKQSILLSHIGVDKQVGVMIGANKCGKTYGAVGFHLGCAVGYRFWDVPGLECDTRTGWLPSRESIPPEYWMRSGDGVPISVPNTGMVVTGLARERGIGQVIWPVMQEICGTKVMAESKVTKGPQGVVTQLVLPNGSKIIYGSADQDPLTFEGTRIQWAHVDEPVKPFVFNGLWRGLLMDMGPILFTLTPLGVDAAWMHEKWVLNPPDNAVVVEVLMRDNPYLDEATIKSYEENGEWTEAERNARLYGKFESLGNRVIHNFDKTVHVVPSQTLPRDWIHGMTVDPHHSRPPFILWWKRSGELPYIYHFYREYPVGKNWSQICRSNTGGLTPTDLGILIRNIEANDIPTIRVCDPRFGKAAQSVHGMKITPWATDMHNKTGLCFDTRVPNVGTVEVGEQLIVDMLRWDHNFPISPSNTPRIFVHDCCVNTIKALENYGNLPNRDQTKVSEKRSEEWKDPVDVIRYTILYPIIAGAGKAIEVYTDQQWMEENAVLGGWYET